MRPAVEITAIRAPTLVIAGSDDEALPVEHSRAIGEGVVGARMLVLEPAAHLANVEQAEAFGAALADHCESGGERRARGTTSAV